MLIKKLFGRVLDIGQSFNQKMLENLQSSRESLGRMFRRMEKEGDEVPDHLLDDAADESGFLEEASEILLVAQWHHAERILKRFLNRADPKAKLKGIDFGDLKKALVLDTYADYKNMNLLRLFANSWKHEAGHHPSPQVFNELGLPEKPTGEWCDSPGLLGNERVRQAIAARIGADPSDPSCISIVQHFSEIVDRFLREVLDRTKFAKDVL